MEQEKEYYAFISYKREDEKWAKWLQKKQEGYKLRKAQPTSKNSLAYNMIVAYKVIIE